MSRITTTATACYNVVVSLEAIFEGRGGYCHVERLGTLATSTRNQSWIRRMLEKLHENRYYNDDVCGKWNDDQKKIT